MTRIVEFGPGHCIGAAAHPSQARYQHMLDNPASSIEYWPQIFSVIDRNDLIAIGGATLVEGQSGGWVLRNPGDRSRCIARGCRRW